MSTTTYSGAAARADAALRVVNYVQVAVGALALLFLAGAACYVAHRQRMIPVLRVLQLRLLILLAAFLWVASVLAGDDAPFAIYRALAPAPADLSDDNPGGLSTHERWCLGQKVSLLAVSEPAFLLLIAQLVQLGATCARLHARRRGCAPRTPGIARALARSQAPGPRPSAPPPPLPAARTRRPPRTSASCAWACCRCCRSRSCSSCLR